MSSPDITVLDEGKLQVAGDFAPILRQNHLDSFEGIMTQNTEKTVRSFPGRTTVRLELKSADGNHHTVYLKRYQREYLSPWKLFLRALRWPGFDDEALREWRQLRGLRAAGFAVPFPVAVGVEKSLGVPIRSLLMTREIAGGVQGDYYCRDLAPDQRRAFLIEVAELTRRFHAAGYIHKDYYLCHIFATPEANTRKLVLLDLQRVTRPRLFCERWRVKDLGALAYSALKFGASRSDLVSLFKTYLAKPRLDRDGKRLARKIIARVQWLSSRRPKHDKAFTQLARRN